MATKMRAAGLAAVVALAMAVGALLGGVLDVAHADLYVCSTPGGAPQACNDAGDLTRGPDEPTEGAAKAAGEASAGEPEAFLCSVTDGCDIPIVFVTEKGEVEKRIVVRVFDPAPTPTPTSTATPGSE